jgi:RNA polymerase sigma-70 factor (ECF subfamily)
MSLSHDDSPYSSLMETVELARAGKQEAFTRLFKHYSDEIYGYVVGLVGNTEDAYDLAQEAFLRAWVRLPMLRDAAKFKPWLYCIARNLVHDYWRRKKRELWKSLERIGEQDVFMSSSYPEEEIAEAELIWLALAEVPVRYRDCLLLQVEGGFSHYEIAELLGIKKACVSTYLCIARRQFRQAYYRLASEQGTTGKGDQLYEESNDRSL